MPYRLLADLVLVLHVGFVAFVVLGGLLARRWRRVPWLHLPAALWGAVVELAGLECPLTPLENALRRAGGEEGYAGDFLARYLSPLLYPPALTRETQYALGAVVVLANLAAYAWAWRGRGR